MENFYQYKGEGIKQDAGGFFVAYPANFHNFEKLAYRYLDNNIFVGVRYDTLQKIKDAIDEFLLIHSNNWTLIESKMPQQGKPIFMLLKKGSIVIGEYDGKIDDIEHFASIHDWIQIDEVKYWKYVEIPEIP